MASAMPLEGEVLRNLRKQLALAVRNIQWSYAIFWSISPTQSGVLNWSGGYYNGDIKIRKTVQAEELNTDQLGFQRSDQLRALYESLSLGESNPQAKRPMASLSPEDLTDAEWYFLICMSFVFSVNQGLPGKSLVKNETIWLCNAHRADTKVFSRSLLAKSASIKTIVCFPHLGGVVELGTTEPAPEDLNLIQHVKTSFLDSPTVSTICNRASNDVMNNNNELAYEAFAHTNIPEDDGLDQILGCLMVNICSPDNSTNEFVENLLRTESNLAEGVDVEASQMQSWPFMDDAISKCLNNSTNSSDCVSPAYEDPNTIVGNNMHEPSHQNNSGFQENNIHFQSVLSNILKSSHQLILGPYSRNASRKSSFVSWTRDTSTAKMTQPRTPQKLLKKVLLEVAKMHENNRTEASKHTSNTRQEDENDRNHVLSERKRREKINERFTILCSLVSSGGKVDKVSILDHTIEYLRGLERKVEELESYKEALERESAIQSKTHQDSTERTSDNGFNGTGSSIKKPLADKRKACATDKTGSENKRFRLRNSDSSSDNIKVIVSGKDVVIEMRCSWRELLLFEVMEAISKLHMQSETVQSSNSDGVLSITVKAKCKGLKAPSTSVIKQALQKVIIKS